MSEHDDRIAEWRGRLADGGKLGEERLEELESHLRDSIGDLRGRGLDEEEAFLVAARRVGNLDALAGEFARAGSEGEWRRIALDPSPNGARPGHLDLAVAVALSLAAGFLSKVPLFSGAPSQAFWSNETFLGNLALACLGPAALLLAFVRGREASLRGEDADGGRVGLAALLVIVTAALSLLFRVLPRVADSQTAILSSIHLPLFLWIALLPLYAGPGKRGNGLDFVRFTGEAFIYGVLLLCGVGVLGAFTSMVFMSAGFDAGKIVSDWILPLGVFAAPVAAMRLALAKRSVVETIAPLLARIFAPLFLLAMLAFIAVALASGRNPFGGRDALIVFDLALAVVFALVLFSSSMRDPRASPGAADWVDLGLALAALAIDLLLLAAMAGRLGAWGASPNRIAALGENIIIMIELAGTAFAVGGHLLARRPYARLQSWQAAFIPVIFAWCGFVALGLPLVFGGR